MRKLLLVGALVACLSLVAVSPASAAKEVGEPCVATGTEANRTLLVFNVTTAQPVVPEEPAQVITSWTVRVGPGLAPLPQRLEVYRVLNEEQDYRKEGESSTVTVGEGVNVFPTRIPVKSFTGYLALYGPGGTFVCDPAPQLAGGFEGAAATGETRRVSTTIGIGVPLTATVEEDRDEDGYGDETQDACPTDPALHASCPPVVAPVTVRSKAEAKRKSILVRVGVSSEALIDVYGQVGWGFKPSPKLKTAGDKPTRLIIGLSGPKKTVLPGKRVPFRVPLPKAVLRRLGRLTPKESLTAKLTVSCTDLAGRIKNQRLDMVLKGRGQ
ncbi:MAG TPA: hypothetical protein VFT10_08970 [Solirubrobacterales bacterium]|nr:hypothetical protein [Solirubrobacterales bacterium]